MIRTRITHRTMNFLCDFHILHHYGGAKIVKWHTNFRVCICTKYRQDKIGPSSSPPPNFAPINPLLSVNVRPTTDNSAFNSTLYVAITVTEPHTTVNHTVQLYRTSNPVLLTQLWPWRTSMSNPSWPLEAYMFFNANHRTLRPMLDQRSPKLLRDVRQGVPHKISSRGTFSCHAGHRCPT